MYSNTRNTKALHVISYYMGITWWRPQIETFSALLALCEGNLPVTGGFPSQRLVTRSFDVFFDLRLNKRLNKQSRHRWFETPSRSLWRRCDEHMHTRQLNSGIVTSSPVPHEPRYRSCLYWDSLCGVWSKNGLENSGSWRCCLGLKFVSSVPRIGQEFHDSHNFLFSSSTWRGTL